MKINSQEFQNKELATAVLFLVFNRLETTKQVFEAIRQAKPPRLYVAADGPREGKLGEVEHVEETRTIVMAVDWLRDVHNKIGFLDERYQYSFDLEWFLRLLKHTRAKHINKIWGAFRLCQDSKTFLFDKKFKEEQKLFYSRIKLSLLEKKLFKFRRFFLILQAGQLRYALRGVIIFLNRFIRN